MKSLICLVAMSLMLAACGGAPPIAGGEVHDRMCEMNPIAVSCGDGAEKTTAALGTPHFVVGPDTEWSFPYNCPNNATDYQMRLSPYTFGGGALTPTRTLLEGPVAIGGNVNTISSYEMPVALGMDGPYHVAYTTDVTVAMFTYPGGPSDGSEPIEIPAYGQWIYAAGERSDYPKGVEVVVMDPHWIGGDGLYDSVGRCTVRKTIIIPL